MTVSAAVGSRSAAGARVDWRRQSVFGLRLKLEKEASECVEIWNYESACCMHACRYEIRAIYIERERERERE